VWGLLVLGATGALSSGVRAQGRVTPLSELTQAAERASHDVEAAKHAVVAADAKLDEAIISPFFQFKATAGLAMVPDAAGVPGYRGNPANELDRGFGPALLGSLEGAVPLWTFGKIGAGREAARQGVKAAEWDVERARNEAVRNVRRAYYALQLSLDSQQLISEGLPKLERALEQIEERMAEGDADVEPNERYRLATALAEVRARKAEATHAEQAARAALALLTGIEDIRVPDCPLAPLPYEPQPEQWYVSEALGERPELAMLDAAAGARRAALDATSAKYFPDLALILELTGQHIPGRTEFEYYRPVFIGAGLVARWQLDFWGNSHRERHAQSKLAETRAKAALARDGIELEVKRHRTALMEARERVAAWEEGHREARRWFVSAAQGHQVGLTSTKDLVDGVSAYFKARFAHLLAIHDHNAALVSLEHATGSRLLDDAVWDQRCDDVGDSTLPPPKPESAAPASVQSVP
jgi:outer membrane protein TolC